MSGRGGRRKGAGRPRRKVPAKRTNLLLSEETRELLALAGDGNMSRGAERLALAFASMLAGKHEIVSEGEDAGKM